VTREAWTLDWKAVNTPLGLPGQSQAVCVRTSFMPLREGLADKPDEVRFYAASPAPDQFSPARLIAAIRDHWGIENRLHHIKDRTWLEDRHWMGNKRTSAVVAMLRSVAVGFVLRAKGRAMKNRPHCPARIEYFNQNPRRALRMLAQPLRL